jgi:hypothetical protein
MTEKYGVDVGADGTKTSEELEVRVKCARCGAPLEETANVPKCPSCGTLPFEDKAL